MDEGALLLRAGGASIWIVTLALADLLEALEALVRRVGRRWRRARRGRGGRGRVPAKGLLFGGSALDRRALLGDARGALCRAGAVLFAGLDQACPALALRARARWRRRARGRGRAWGLAGLNAEGGALGRLGRRGGRVVEVAPSVQKRGLVTVGGPTAWGVHGVRVAARERERNGGALTGQHARGKRQPGREHTTADKVRGRRVGRWRSGLGRCRAARQERSAEQ